MSEDKKELKNEELCEEKKKLSMEDLKQVFGGTGSMNFPCPKCGGPGYICNGHYWCDNYKTCGYHNAVVKAPTGEVNY